METFTLFWLDGKSELVKGKTVADAFTQAGYGAGAVRALDFTANGDKRAEYAWNKEKRKWEKVNGDEQKKF